MIIICCLFPVTFLSFLVQAIPCHVQLTLFFIIIFIIIFMTHIPFLEVSDPYHSWVDIIKICPNFKNLSSCNLLERCNSANSIYRMYMKKLLNIYCLWQNILLKKYSYVSTNILVNWFFFPLI